MRYELLGRRRRDWIAYLRAIHALGQSRCYGGSNYDDGMCCGIVPFGAPAMWASDRAARAAQAALAVPVAHVVAYDAVGLVLAVPCPYCGAEHRHVVTEDWDPSEALAAECGKGAYRVTVGR